MKRENSQVYLQLVSLIDERLEGTDRIWLGVRNWTREILGSIPVNFLNVNFLKSSKKFNAIFAFWIIS